MWGTTRPRRPRLHTLALKGAYSDLSRCTTTAHRLFLPLADAARSRYLYSSRRPRVLNRARARSSRRMPCINISHNHKSSAIARRLLERRPPHSLGCRGTFPRHLASATPTPTTTPLPAAPPVHPHQSRTFSARSPPSSPSSMLRGTKPKRGSRGRGTCTTLIDRHGSRREKRGSCRRVGQRESWE